MAKLMQIALAEALKAARADEVPVGAVILDPEGKILAKAHNDRKSANNPIGHAEVLAIIKAAKKLKTWHLDGCTLVTTLEPCTMCAGAIINSRISTVIFSCYDPKAGALGSLYNVAADPRLNHNPEVISSICEKISSQLLKSFFNKKR
jgi:tRNA(adenine34) deaminase